MIPEEIYKRRRRHNNTPPSILLIITNYMACCVLFTMASQINWFFGIALVLLAVYNFFTIRRNREEYNRVHIIAYVISLAGIVLLYFVTHNS
jgi:uncharacterized membrane protein